MPEMSQMAVAGRMFGWTIMDSKQHLNDPFYHLL